MRDLHRHGVRTNDSLFYLGSALMMRKSWTEALEAFESIDGPLKPIDNEATRWNNIAVALQHMGRRDDAAKVLLARISESWPENKLKKARRILADLSQN
jgi:uncharacterized protein HemY